MPVPANAKGAFAALLAYFDSARAPDGEPCTFLLDEVLELRTFESFPGLRHVLRELLDGNYAAATEALIAHRPALDAVASALIERETISGDDVRQVVAQFRQQVA